MNNCWDGQKGICLRHTFIKAERISRQKEIDDLFERGLSFSVYPLHVVYLTREMGSEVPVSILVSVPKKRFKRAVKRNRIKRLIRESYRLSKYRLWELLAAKDRGLLIAFIYISSKLCSYSQMEMAMNKVLDTLIAEYQ